jgi:ech hydrogenase subunit E
MLPVSIGRTKGALQYGVPCIRVKNGRSNREQSNAEGRVRGNPEGEVLVRVEQPRGEVVYYVRANGEKHLERMKIRTPTFANPAALPELLPGLELADVPLVLLSLDPCIACTER